MACLWAETQFVLYLRTVLMVTTVSSYLFRPDTYSEISDLVPDVIENADLLVFGKLA